jgi:hypothetical protein
MDFFNSKGSRMIGSAILLPIQGPEITIYLLRVAVLGFPLLVGKLAANAISVSNDHRFNENRSPRHKVSLPPGRVCGSLQPTSAVFICHSRGSFLGPRMLSDRYRCHVRCPVRRLSQREPVRAPRSSGSDDVHGPFRQPQRLLPQQRRAFCRVPAGFPADFELHSAIKASLLLTRRVWTVAGGHLGPPCGRPVR